MVWCSQLAFSTLSSDGPGSIYMMKMPRFCLMADSNCYQPNMRTSVKKKNEEQTKTSRNKSKKDLRVFNQFGLKKKHKKHMIL